MNAKQDICFSNWKYSTQRIQPITNLSPQFPDYIAVKKADGKQSLHMVFWWDLIDKICNTWIPLD